jgi:serine/threonine protein kinase/Tol biopolymer transport system component
MPGQAGRTLRPEDEISHYRIVSPLAAGGMGEVYLAQDRRLERNVALKILPPELVKDKDRVRRFDLEAKSASGLSHPNIVTIYEIGHDVVRSPGAANSDPVHFISMELVSGKTLSTLIHEDRTDLRTLVGYLAQAAEGLSKAHAAGIVHRDLKPGNIMVSTDGFTKVLDFGLAKLTEKRDGPDIAEEETMARDGSAVGSVVGTAAYMSPEQVQGKAVDHRSDIFSFGCILYEAATRRKPFAAETGIETMHKILNEKPVPVEELNDKVPAELRRLIKRCLAKSPDQRVQSVKDLAIELREIAEEYDALSASASSSTHTSGVAATAKPSRRPGPPGAAVAAVLVLGGLAAGWWVWHRKAAPAPKPAFQSMRMSTQTSRGDVFEATISPDGRYLAYLAGTAGRVSLRVRQVATGSDVEVLPTRDAGLEGPTFSPDGNYVFYLARRPDNLNYRALYEVASLGGTPRERVFDVDSRACFAPDGKRLAFWRHVNLEKQSRLVVFDLDAGKESVIAKLDDPESYQGGPSWSPDGRTIAAALLKPAPDFRATVTLFDAGSGERRELLSLPRTILNGAAWLPDGQGLAVSAQNLTTSINQQLYLVGYPDPQQQRVTNDFYRYLNVSVSKGEEAIAAVRVSRLANLWIADATGGAARQISSTVNPEESHFFVSVAAPDTVVYDAPRDQSVQIWAQSVAGGEPRTLTTGDALSINPRAAGKLVVYDKLDASGVHIWSMNLDGSNQRKLSSGGGAQAAAVSPDGRFAAYFPIDAPQSVALITLDSGKVETLATSVTGGLAGFSPDSSRLMVGRPELDAAGLQRTVWQAISVGGGAETATFRLPNTAMEPAWAPDGQAMTFRNRADAAWNVFRQDASGKEPVAVTHFTEGRVTGYQWSPDGSRLAVIRRTDDGANVWVTGKDGSRPLQVTQLPSSDVFFARWLPDNRRLAISAGKLSRDAVLIKSFR